MPHSDFVHLHVHTHYSLLDGAIKIDPLVQRAAEYKMPALAITDYGNMFGAIEFYQKARRAGLKPVIGCEVYVAPKSRLEKDTGGIPNASFHFILLAANRKGYENLLHLVSAAHTEGFYYRPRIDKALLAEYSEGLVGLSSGLRGEIAYSLRRGEIDRAMRAAGEYRDILGKDHFYLEIQAVDTPAHRDAAAAVSDLSKKIGLPLVGTNDCHYLNRSDAKTHDILRCLQTGKTFSDSDRMRHPTDDMYFKSPQEMVAAFSHIPDAIRNTREIAERCSLELTFDNIYLPHYDVPGGESREAFLERMARAGLAAHLNRTAATEAARVQYAVRLEKELRIINSMGYAGYFLIVWDIVNFARGRGIPVGPGRGSAAGSLVAYCLKITDIDPIPYGLLFERFLNPERVSLPDIDMDFCMTRRGEVFDYVTQKYGADHVSQIITFGTMAAKAAIRDVGRVMELPYAEVDRVAKLVPNVLNITLEDAIAQEPKLRELSEQNPKIQELLTLARGVEGLARHASTHAAGIVISQDPLTRHTPLYRGSNDEIVTQFAKDDIEKIGLVKFDLLGLRTLTVIEKAAGLVSASAASPLDVAAVPLNDEETYRMLGTGNTTGIFQLESSGMVDLLVKMKPERFEDLVAILALYRPGPIGSGMLDDFIKRKRGKTAIRYEIPQLEEILRETYGVIVYQEQVMRIANVVAGFTLGEADLLRRAMGKKKPEEMDKQKNRFIDGAKKNAISEKKAEKIFDLMAYFAGYGFNKCLPGDTRVYDFDTGRMRPIGDLYREGRCIAVATLDETLRLVRGKVSCISPSGSRDILRLKTRNGRSIRATSNHPFCTPRGWISLDELQPGDRIAVPRILPSSADDVWPDHACDLLGYVTSEGNLCHPSSFYFYSNDPTELADYVAALRQFDNTTPTYSTWKGRKLTAVYASRTEPSRPSEAVQWVEGLGLRGVKATEKALPDAVFSLRNECVARILGKMWVGDGCVNRAGMQTTYATSSERLAGQVRHLLLRLGILSTLHEKRFRYRGGHKRGWTIVVTGRDALLRFASLIGTHLVGPRNLQLKSLVSLYRKREASDRLLAHGTSDTIPNAYLDLIRAESASTGLTFREIARRAAISERLFIPARRKKGFTRETVDRMARTVGSERLAQLARSDIHWDAVETIEADGREETYDLQVEGTHNFVAEDIIVHNSHSAAYALISYQTAYLKAHHPKEFMAALLSTEMGNEDKLVRYIRECREMGIAVLPPDVNESMTDFTVAADGIRFGLAAVKNVGAGAVESIIASRGAGGPFKSFIELCRRIDTRKVNKRVLEGLIKCGAFDSTGARRAALMGSLETVMEEAALFQKQKEMGQESLFGDSLGRSEGGGASSSQPRAAEWDEAELLRNEKEALGFYITSHPLACHAEAIKSLGDVTTATLEDKPDGAEVRLCGVIGGKKVATTKKGDKMAYLRVEDLEGSVEVIFFPDLYRGSGSLISSEAPLLFTGTLSKGEQGVRIKATAVEPLASVRERSVRRVDIRLTSTGLGKDDFQAIKEILLAYPGACPVTLTLNIPDKGMTTLAVESRYHVSPTEALSAELEGIFGKGTVVFR